MTNGWLRDFWVVLIHFKICGISIGCREDGAGSDMVPGSGRVMVDAKPVAGAEVGFWSAEYQHVAFTDTDGRYRLTAGGHPETYKITIRYLPAGLAAVEPGGPLKMPDKSQRAASPPVPLPPRFGDPKTTDLTLTIASPGTDSANFDLTQ